MGIIGIVRNFYNQYINKLEELEESDASPINESGLYRDFEELPSNQKSILEDLLLPDEEFQMCVTLKGTVNAPHLTVTNMRIIKAENTATGYNSESFDLGSISQFDYDDGLTKSTISISGSGIDEEFEVSSLTTQDMDEFQQAVYKHK